MADNVARPKKIACHMATYVSHSVRVCECASVHVCTCVHVCACVRVCVCVCVHMCVRVIKEKTQC